MAVYQHYQRNSITFTYLLKKMFSIFGAANVTAGIGQDM